MKRPLVLAPLALCLMAFRCGGDTPPAVEFPTLQPLSAETVVPCPETPMLTGALDDLVTKDSALAIEYAKCRARAATAVGAYQDAQRLLQQAADKANRSKTGSAAPHVQ